MRLMTLSKWVLILGVLLATALGAAAHDEAPAEILIERQGFMPEGIEWDEDAGHFLLGSLGEGTIFTVMDDGTITPFIEDEHFLATIGIHIDQANKRLLVCNSDARAFSDPTAEVTAGIGSYDLATGEEIFYADLTPVTPEGMRPLCNDVTVDADGNAYGTNSLAPIIYKVTPEGEASVFVQNDLLGNPNFGLNGIDAHPDGYLLAAVTGAGAIIRIPLDDPDSMVAVELSEPVGIDGMILAPDGMTVYAVARAGDMSTQELVQIVSEDDWATAAVADRAPTGNNGTTVTLRHDEPFIINAYFSEPTREVYDIDRIDFEE